MKSILKTIGVFAISILAIALASYTNEVKAIDSLGGLPALNIQANDWLDLYTSDPKQALTTILNFLIVSCGCNTLLTKEDLDNDSDDIIDIIYQQTKEENDNIDNIPD
jgi:hypothetical protein